MTYTNAALAFAEIEREPRPVQTGSGSKVAHYSKGMRKKRRPIIHRIVRFVKMWRRLIALLVTVFLILFLVGFAVYAALERGHNGAATVPEAPEDTLVEEQAVAQTDTFYAVRDGETVAINWEALTNAWAAEAGFEKRYELTDAERLIVAQVVEAEATGEPYAGKVAVAQCILQACEDDGIRPDVAVRKYGYSSRRPEPSQESLDAVQDVFDFGHYASTEPIKYFYAPDRTTSSWHETQIYVMTINGHRFFKEASN